jgi:hypothetical protein
MSSLRVAFRPLRSFIALSRPLSTSATRSAGPGKAQRHENNDEHRKYQTEKPLNPHLTNSNSTISNDMPSVGAHRPPPELISSVGGNLDPKDADPENTQRMTGGTQSGGDANASPGKELGVGELEGGTFKVEPLRRTGEDANTMRARLLCQAPCPVHISFPI